jgi:hypothetical protein
MRGLIGLSAVGVGEAGLHHFEDHARKLA